MLREEPQKCSDDTERDLISDTQPVSSSIHMETNQEKLSKNDVLSSSHVPQTPVHFLCEQGPDSEEEPRVRLNSLTCSISLP